MKIISENFEFISVMFYLCRYLYRLIVIPISTIVSGASFGLFMACGSMVRSYEGKELKYKSDEDLYNSMYWKTKYAV